MSSIFSLTVRFLDPVPSFHGRSDGGEPEWPPSPLRVYQALVAAAASLWRESQFAAYAKPALKWLELRTPMVIAPSIQAERTGYRMYVPNNAGDLVTSAWARDNMDAKFSSLNVEKDVRPTRLIGGDWVSYLWLLTEPPTSEVERHLATLSSAARSITHLGWGIDMVAANATVISQEEAARLPGERWLPTEDSAACGYRVPIAGTLAALASRHEAFLNRVSSDGFKPVPPLTSYRVIGYRRDSDPATRPWTAFKLLHPSLDRPAAFSPLGANRVAAQFRHATAQAAKYEKESWVCHFVHGHRKKGGETTCEKCGAPWPNQPNGEESAERLPRFSYLPLPSIERRGNRGGVVSGIRRVLLAELNESSESYLSWAKQMLPGQFLVDENSKERKAMLVPLNPSDWVLGKYVGTSDIWATVTPIVLPGCDNGKAAKAEKLLFKSLQYAGFSPQAVADYEFRNVSFWPGGDLARRFDRPDYLEKNHWSVYHMRLRWKNPIAGPLALGSGRHCGLGIFASMRKQTSPA